MRSYNGMSNLNFKHKQPLVNLFDAMAMRLTDEGMIDFFEMDVKINIEDMKYLGGIYRPFPSMQDRFVEFLKKEDDHIVAKAIEAMIKEIESGSYGPLSQHGKTTINECKSIIARLRSSNPTTSGNLDDLNNIATITIDNADHLVGIIRRLKQSIDTNPDPGLAIDTATKLIESVCKTILSEREKPVGKSPKFTDLIRDTLEVLKLVPEGTHEEKSGSDAIKKLLKSNGHNLGTLRNLYGGHGNHAKAKGLSPRHAKLVAGAASTLALFLFETHEENKVSTNQNAHRS